MGGSLHNNCNEFHIDFKQKRGVTTIQSNCRMFHHSISTQSSMALSVQFRTISHLTTDDHWNGCLFNCLRSSHSRNNSICFAIDVAIHRLGFLCRNHQYRISTEFNEVISASKFTRFTHETKNNNADDNQTDTNNSSRIDLLVVQEIRNDCNGRNTNT